MKLTIIIKRIVTSYWGIVRTEEVTTTVVEEPPAEDDEPWMDIDAVDS